MASLDDGVPYDGPEAMSRRSDNSSSETINLPLVEAAFVAKQERRRPRKE